MPNLSLFQTSYLPVTVQFPDRDFIDKYTVPLKIPWVSDAYNSRIQKIPVFRERISFEIMRIL